MTRRHPDSIRVHECGHTRLTFGCPACIHIRELDQYRAETDGMELTDLVILVTERSEKPGAAVDWRIPIINAAIRRKQTMQNMGGHR